MMCRDCAHYRALDKRAGECLKQRWDHPEQGTIYGLAFASEGDPDPSVLDCDMAEGRSAVSPESEEGPP